ncbi:MAG: tetratricopeptide repeat protein, partial [Planctomycetota bacterium]|nr:tetratricopeptide repeat protein [Planctomycetota bacterium]
MTLSLLSLFFSTTIFADEATDTFNLANGIFIVEDYETALGYYDEVLKFPKFKHAEEARFRKAECLYRLKKYEAASKDFEAVLARNADFKEAQTARYRLGEIYLNRLEKYDKAAVFYGELALKDPKHKL